MAITSTQQTEILKIVSGLFNAAPGGANLTELANLVQGGMTTSQLADALAAHSLFTGTIMAGKVTTSSQVNVLMSNFGLTADSDPASAGSQAQAYFTQQIDAGVGFGKIVYDAVQFLSGSVPPEFTTAATLLSNKALVAAAYSESNSSTNLSALQNVVANVTGTAAYTDQDVQDILDDAGASGGQTFTLTTGSDVINGTSGNDTVVGILSGALGTGSTIQPGDQINGGGGTADTLNINISGDASGAFTLASITTSGVEKILVSNYDAHAGDTTINMSTMSDVTNFGTTGSSATGDTIFSNIKAIAALQAAGEGDVTASYLSAAVSGTTDTQTVAVDNFTGLLKLSEIETVTISAAGTKSTISTLNTDTGTQDATTLNINASVALTITTDLNTNSSELTKIDASGSTAAVTLTTSDTETKAMTFGSGDDVLVRNANAAADTVDAGDGTDTLKVTTGANATSTNLANYKNFEVLEVTGGVGATVALSGVTQFNKIVNSDSGTGTTAYTGVGAGVQTLAITVANGSDENVTLSLATNTTSDSINVEVGPATGTTAVTMGTLTLNDHETINIASAGANNSIGVLTSGNATKLVATGAKDLTVSAFTSSSNLKTIDASAMTAAFIMGATSAATGITVTGGSGNDTLIGGSGNDSLTGGAGVDSITAAGGNDTIGGGDGNDVIVVSAAGTYGVTAGAGDDTVTIDGSNIGSTDTLTGGEGTDTIRAITAALDWNDAADATDLSNVSGFEKIEIGFAATTYAIGDVVMGLFNGDATISSKVSGVVTLDAASVLSSSNTVRFSTTSTSDNVHTYVIGNGKDIVDYSTMGTTAANVVKVSNALFLQSTDSFKGSSNTGEKLTFDTDGAITITAAQLGGLSGIEAILVDNTNTKTGAAVITLNDTVVSANKISSTGIFAVSRDSDESGTLKVDGSAVTAGNLSVTGGDGADTLIGGSGNDTLTGDQGAGGIDSMTGGAGNDTFVLSDTTAIDVITDANFGTSNTSIDIFKMSNAALSVTLDTAIDTITTGTATSAVAATDILIITDQTYADEDALDAGLENTNAVTLTNDVLVIYQDSLGNVRLALMDTAGGALANNAADVTTTDLAKLTGVSISGISSLIDAGDFSFVA